MSLVVINLNPFRDEYRATLQALIDAAVDYGANEHEPWATEAYKRITDAVAKLTREATGGARGSK